LAKKKRRKRKGGRAERSKEPVLPAKERSSVSWRE
jgi:hypothetical protein